MTTPTANEAFWKKSHVAVIGAGSWGTVLANLASQNCSDVRMWVRQEETARAINATRTNSDYAPELVLSQKVHAYSSMERVFEGGVDVVIWALPSAVTRAHAAKIAPLLRGSEVILHAAKGVEDATLKRVSDVLREELPCPRIGVISGPNLASEVAAGSPAATVVASQFDEVLDCGQALLATQKFRVYRSRDVAGVEWGGVLKNVYAIAAGISEAMNLGWNARAMLMTRALAEMVRFGVAQGAEVSTFIGLSGVGDLLATCSSPLSRNFRFGMHLASGMSVKEAMTAVGQTVEGARTATNVWAFAKKKGIEMPITEGVAKIIDEGADVKDILRDLMTRPQRAE